VSDPDALLDVLVGDDEWSRHERLQELRTGGAPSALIDALGKRLAGDDPSRRASARMALAALAHPDSPARDDALRYLENALRSADVDLRILAASALGESENADAVPALVAALEDPAPNVVAAAADALGALRDPSSLEPLARLTVHGEAWVRLAAVVALGRLGDVRALPALERLAAEPGLEGALVEALQRLGHPAALPLLERLYPAVPEQALVAAAAILSATTGLEPPAWVREGAAERAPGVLHRMIQEQEPAVARLLGLGATDEAIETLLHLACAPRRSEAALNGLVAVPPELLAEPILSRLPTAEPDDQVMMLSLLPPLQTLDRAQPVVPLLTDADARVRAAAAEALARSSPQPALQVLSRELSREAVAPEVVRAAGALGEAVCLALMPLLRDRDPAVRAAAADALGRCDDVHVPEALEAALEGEGDPTARRSILRSLGRIAGAAAVPALARALDEPDPETRVVALEALGTTGAPDALKHLRSALDGPPAEALAAIRSLGELGRAEARPLIERFLTSPDLDRRRTAALAALAFPAAFDLPVIDALATDPDAWIRAVAVRLLASRRDGGPILERLAARDPDPEVRARARDALAGGP
jgi:HEAT repeat protein